MRPLHQDGHVDWKTTICAQASHVRNDRKAENNQQKCTANVSAIERIKNGEEQFEKARIAMKEYVIFGIIVIQNDRTDTYLQQLRIVINNELQLARERCPYNVQ